MNKYINIILLSFFGVLTIKYEVGYSLFIPIAFFFINHNKKTMFLIIPISIISVYFLNRQSLLSLILFYSVSTIYILLVSKKNQWVNSLFILIINYISLIVVTQSFNKTQLLIFIIYSLLSSIMYLFFEFNYQTKNHSSFSYNESLVALITILGGTLYNYYINIGLVLGIYFVMYFSKNKYMISLIVVNLVTILFFKYYLKIDASFMIIVSAIYLLPKYYHIIILCMLSVFMLLIKQNYVSAILITYTIGIAIFFEIFKPMLTNIDNTKEKFLNYIYEKQIANVNNEIIAFASFLDSYAKKYSTAKEFDLALTQGINLLVQNYCNGCYKRNECHHKNRGKLYSIFKDILLYYQSEELNEAEVLTSYCPSIVEMRKSSIIINQQLGINKSYSKQNALVYQINGISNILRQYTIDNTLKKEIDYNTIMKLKRTIIDSGLSLCYMELKKILVEDFLIELGFRNCSFSELKPRLLEICNLCLNDNASIVFKSSTITKTYVNLVPKINYEITYGYGVACEETNSICGDNYLIKQLNNSRLIAAISDGMGKGYNANKQSSETIKMIEEVMKLPITTVTSLQILNTFYFIQDYLDKYSTVDFLEINRNNGEAMFYKMGAASSYIFHKNLTFDKIENQNLPFGIEETIDQKVMEIKDGDLIVMASDGIFDNVVNEVELEKYIMQISHLVPQQIAYEILSFVKKNKVKAKDDKSIIVLKIEKASN